MLEAIIFVVFPFCMAFAAVSDMLSMTIANRVSVILILTFAIVAPLTGMGWSDYGMHFAAGAVVLCVTFGLFALGGMGGGDAKLMSAIAVWFGFSTGLITFVLTASVIGGSLTLALIHFRGSSLAMVTGNNVLLRHFADSKAGIPYGIALGFAGLLTYPQTEPMQWVLERLSAL